MARVLWNRFTRHSAEQVVGTFRQCGGVWSGRLLPRARGPRVRWTCSVHCCTRTSPSFWAAPKAWNGPRQPRRFLFSRRAPSTALSCVSFGTRMEPSFT
ncbi:hypothetical protein BC830DRAFT_1231234 [Chytriomyces sp. MP71]|nr:hypothetical protein BC830DRAFT_1231234 [Chytriomyces sp. MP71]